MSHFWGRPSIPDQAINVVLGPSLTGGDFEDIGSAQQQLLGVSVRHGLPRGQEEGFVLGRERKDHRAPLRLGYHRIPRKGVPTTSHSPGERGPQISFPKSQRDPTISGFLDQG